MRIQAGGHGRIHALKLAIAGIGTPRDLCEELWLNAINGVFLNFDSTMSITIDIHNPFASQLWLRQTCYNGTDSEFGDFFGALWVERVFAHVVGKD